MTPDIDQIEALVNTVRRDGLAIPSRYGDTTEILDGYLRVPAGTLARREGMNLTLGWMEMLQFLAGIYDFQALKRVAPNADLSLFTYAMAYGPRIFDQIPEVIDVLQSKPESRQAVVLVAKPEDGMTSKLPCTLSIQFLIRRDRLNAIVSMRSWDVCRGLPYDLMMFSGLAMAVARCLYIDPGWITINAGSIHIYDEWIHKTPSTDPRSWKLASGLPSDWTGIQTWAFLSIRHLEKGGTPWGIEIPRFSAMADD